MRRGQGQVPGGARQGLQVAFAGNEQALARAALPAHQLQQALAPLGIAPDLQIQEISAAAFLQDPLQSNQVLIAGQPIEHWLGGQAGRSRCCNECGDNDCRTLEVGGQQYEAIPEDLLVRAALVAASRMLDPTL